MWRYILRRILGTIPVLFLMLILTFAMLKYIPGGPYDSEKELPPEALQSIQAHYALDSNIWVQFGNYVWDMAHGDFGLSCRQMGWSVSELLRDKIAVSFELAFWSMALAILLGTLWGMQSAIKEGTGFDRKSIFLTTLLICIPSFVLGPVLNDIFAFRLGWFRSIGWNNWHNKTLPILTLSLCYIAVIARLTRQSMLQESHELYFRTARAKGLSREQAFRRHLFLNGIQPVIAYLGPTCAAVFSGTFVVESIFNIPGLGRLFIESIGNRDYTVITGVLVLYTILILIFNLIADILLAVINPKITLY